MNSRLITDSEIAQRQLEIRIGAQNARNGFTVMGLRQLLGNTFIALGTLLHGHNEKCQESLGKMNTAVPARGLEI